MATHNIPDKLQDEQAIFPASGRAWNISTTETPAFMVAWGPTAIADASTGYGVGCTFKNTTDGVLYTNVGTSASSNFDAISASAVLSELTLVSAAHVATHSELQLVSAATADFVAGDENQVSVNVVNISANLVKHNSTSSLLSAAIVRMNSEHSLISAVNAQADSLTIVANAVSEAVSANLVKHASTSSLLSAAIVRTNSEHSLISATNAQADSLTIVANAVSEAVVAQVSFTAVNKTEIANRASEIVADLAKHNSTSSLLSALIVRTTSEHSLVSANFAQIATRDALQVLSVVSSVTVNTANYLKISTAATIYKVPVCTIN